MTNERNEAADVRLDETDLRAALFAVAELLRYRPGLPPSLWRLRDKLTAAIEAGMSLSGHECDCDAIGLRGDDTEWIGTALAAAALGVTPRHVRRIHDHLGGRRVGDRLLFPATAIRDHAAALKENRSA